MKNYTQNYTPKAFAEMIGVSVKTLQRWDREGILKAYRSPTNRRYYTDEHYNKYADKNEQKQGKAVIYARISKNDQYENLTEQAEILKQYAKTKKITIAEIFCDVDSGLNYEREKWNQLIDRCRDGEITTILITNKDRFVNLGYEWFERFLQSVGTKIIIVNEE